jgi:hypothetical protein
MPAPAKTSRQEHATTPRSTSHLILFTATLFLGSTLLFLVEPMVGKMILPRFGGVPAVWNTCMVFFQAALLAGYAYSHAATTWLGRRRQGALHLALLMLPFVVLPVALPPEWSPPGDANPIGPLLGVLFVAVGLPFFVVATSAPLLQKWFADSDPTRSRNPYVLYAASNAGSMLALLAYPALIEPVLTLRTQSLLWAGGYLFFVILMAACAVILWRSAVPASKETSATEQGRTPPRRVPAPLWARVRTRLHWVALAFVPSSLMLGVTTYFSTDIAPVPLLWVVPLALYLLSFMIAFSRSAPPLYRLWVFMLPPLLILLAIVMVSDPLPMSVLIPLHLATFFVAALVCHAELARCRPAAELLTEFFLWLSVGGVLGGCFNALVAPLVFSSILEYRLALLFAALLLPPLLSGTPAPQARWLNRLAPAGLAAVVAAIFAWPTWSRDVDRGLVHRERSFFGVLRVLRGTDGRTNTFVHGNVRHGIQLRSADPRQRRLPMVYYFPTGPAGQVFQEFHGPRAKGKVGLIGLGIGSLASYAEAGQEFTFFEIDPAVERLARDIDSFTYLVDAEARGARVRVVLGDARLTLRREPEASFDMIVLDAFSGDAIPTHLLTREAMQVYLNKLNERGILLLHITNDYLDLRPVLADQATAAGLFALVQEDSRLSSEELRRGKVPSTWAVMARRKEDLGKLTEDTRWQRLSRRDGSSAWTDDFSNILQVFRWK